MKNSLFEMLMNFFEKSLSQLKESEATDTATLSNKANTLEEAELNDTSPLGNPALFCKSAQKTSLRVFTYDEQMKFTKASYQFLMRLIRLGFIASDTMELVINQLFFSESPFVTLQETKWTIRNLLAEDLNKAQLTFLDLVLYQKEDEHPLH